MDGGGGSCRESRAGKGSSFNKDPLSSKRKKLKLPEYESSGHFYPLRSVEIVLTFCFHPVSLIPSFQLPRDKESRPPSQDIP